MKQRPTIGLVLAFTSTYDDNARVQKISELLVLYEIVLKNGYKETHLSTNSGKFVHRIQDRG